MASPSPEPDDEAECQDTFERALKPEVEGVGSYKDSSGSSRESIKSGRMQKR